MFFCRDPTILSHTMKMVACTALIVPMLGGPAIAQTLMGRTLEAEATPPLPTDLFSGKRGRDVLAAQVMLDRAGFSPGVIDGYSGGNTARAVKAFQTSAGLTSTGHVDAEVLASLRSGDQAPAVIGYKVTEADVAGPFGDLPAGMEALADLKSTHYESAAEALAEKFHMSEQLLRDMNPTTDFTQAGSMISVVATQEQVIDSAVARIEIDGSAAELRAYAKDGRLLASYPANRRQRRFSVAERQNGSASGRTGTRLLFFARSA